MKRKRKLIVNSSKIMSSSSFLDRFHFGQHQPFSWENFPVSVAGVVTVLGGGDWGAAGVDGVAAVDEWWVEHGEGNEKEIL